MMKDLVNTRVNEYIDELTRESDVALKEIENLAEQMSFPIVGPQVGKVLYLIAKIKNARCVFEMGSGFGYSAWWFAKALGPRAKVHLTDRSKENLKMAKDFLTRVGLSRKIVFHCGDAVRAFKDFKGKVDILFVDMDKELYPKAYHHFKERCRNGSILIADNMLWDGRVLKDARDEATRGIKEFTRLVFDDPELESTILPIRDGVLLSTRA
jgi:predicted O-methyltransferase YrrM